MSAIKITPCPSYLCPWTLLIELGSAGTALWWSLLLFLPVHLFSTNAAFGYLPHVAQEWKWGMGSLVVGCWQLAAAIHRRPLWRWAGLCLCSALWGGVCACLAEGAKWQYHLPLNTGCGCYGVTVLMANLCALLLSPYVLADLTIWAGRKAKQWQIDTKQWQLKAKQWAIKRPRGK